MFNFTTQSVYNAIATTGANKNMWVASASKKPALRIGNTRFDKDYILDIQVKNPTVEALASAEFDLSEVLLPDDSIDNEGTGRIALYIGLSMNCQDSLYANDLVYKGKPLFIEFPIKKSDTADVLATRVKAIADKYMLLIYGQKILDIEATSTAADAGNSTDAVGKIKFTGINGYQQIKKAVLQFFDPDAKTVDCCTTQGEYKDVIVGVPVIYTTSATGVVTATASGSVGDIDITGDKASNVGIIVPQTVTSGKTLFTITYNSHDYTYALTANQPFAAGNKYTYTFTLNLAGLQLESVSINDWTAGGSESSDIPL